MNDLYTYTIPTFIKTLGGLKNSLTKAEAFAKEKGMDEEKFLADQLWPDMFPLSRQVQIATDNAKGLAARLAGMEPPKYEDSEKTFAELFARIDKTIAFLATIDEKSFEGAAARKITLPYFSGQYMTGFDYAREYAIPNFFFHTVTAYALMRKNGVPLGKADYINGVPLKDL